MSEIVLKNFSGEDVQYSGVEKVLFNTADGGMQPFSKGEAVEGVEIALDFSSGDQTVNAAEGTLVKSAVIKKPETLIPENISEGVSIAGIIGTLAGGGSGGNIVAVEGSYMPSIATETDEIVVTHNLGVIPDIIFVFPNNACSSGYFGSLWGMSAELYEKTGLTFAQNGIFYGSNLGTLGSKSGINESGAGGYIKNANEQTFTIGGRLVKHDNGRPYLYRIIGGLIEH